MIACMPGDLIAPKHYILPLAIWSVMVVECCTYWVFPGPLVEVVLCTLGGVESEAANCSRFLVHCLPFQREEFNWEFNSLLIILKLHPPQYTPNYWVTSLTAKLFPLVVLCRVPPSLPARPRAWLCLGWLWGSTLLRATPTHVGFNGCQLGRQLLQTVCDL